MNHSKVMEREPNVRLASKLKVAIWIVTFIVLGLVGMMRRIKIELPDGVQLDFLPAVHATLNSCVAVLLIVALIMVKRGKIAAHRRAVSAAMICSMLFLICYVAYHFTSEETKFGGQGWLRIVYFTLLASHIVLAAISLPFILFTWMFGFTNQFEKHRRFARWVFPVWLYVAITGPICYLMLRPYY